jgi:O-succinylbenzoic acid--CoA ligase
MEKRTKELRSVSVESAHSVMDELARALSGIGPALAFGPTSSTTVPDSIAIVVATSGSTGKPKEVALSASAILASAKASHEFIDARFGETWSLLLPLTHIAGVNVLARSLELGTAPIDLRGASRFPRSDFTAVVPTQLFRALSGDNLLLTHLQNCKAVLVGGAALTSQLKSRAIAAGIHVVTTYGMTETCGGCVYDGEMLNGVDVEIRDGFIAIKSTSMATTYLNDESSWDTSFHDGWFLTQDLGVLESNHLKVLGRRDEIMISGGEKISLSKVEEIIKNDFPSISVAAFPVEDDEWGSTLHLAIASNSTISNDEIAQSLTRALGVVAKPKGFLRVATIPLTGIGKVDRNALVELSLTERGKI